MSFMSEHSYKHVFALSNTYQNAKCLQLMSLKNMSKHKQKICKQLYRTGFKQSFFSLKISPGLPLWNTKWHSKLSRSHIAHS